MFFVCTLLHALYYYILCFYADWMASSFYCLLSVSHLIFLSFPLFLYTHIRMHAHIYVHSSQTDKHTHAYRFLDLTVELHSCQKAYQSQSECSCLSLSLGDQHYSSAQIFLPHLFAHCFGYAEHLNICCF